MAAVVPKNNLPPDSQAWVRRVEDSINNLELTSSNLNTLAQGNNARLSPLVNSVNSLTNAVSQLTQTVNFLAQETVSVNLDNTGWTTTLLGTNSPPFDPIYDLEILFTPGASSSFTVSLSNTVQHSTNTSGGSMVSRLYLEMTELDGAPITPDTLYSLDTSFTTLVTSGGHNIRNSMFVTRDIDISSALDPNNTYRFRTRRQATLTNTGTTGTVSLSDPTLSIRRHFILAS